MALFSRRKKTTDALIQETSSPSEEASAAADAAVADSEQEEAAPAVSISVQAFRGVGEEAGPSVSLPQEGEEAPTAPRLSAPTAPRPTQAPPRVLPLAPVEPPEQTETVPGMQDNVLLREALAQIQPGATNDQLLGVLRQALQGHLFLRVGGDAREQMAAGKPLSIGVIRDGERAFMLAYSSAAAVQESVNQETEPVATSVIAQPTTAVLQQLGEGGFSGLVLDNASDEHRVVLPAEVLAKALEQADEKMTLKTLLAAPRDGETLGKAAQALASVPVWVAVSSGENGTPVGIAEARTAEGQRYLQLFSHPLEIVVLGRGDRPVPFAPEQLAKVLSTNPDISGVMIDFAGPSLLVPREALGPVLVLAVDLDD